MDKEKKVIRSVFGKEVDLSTISGLDVTTLLEAHQDLLKVEDGDPDFEYGWLDTRDPMTSNKIRKGLWELVDPETDPVICAGALRDSKTYRVNELVLARMPKATHDRLMATVAAIALRREAAITEQYKDTVKNVSKAITPDATGEPTVQKTEVVKDVPAWVK